MTWQLMGANVLHRSPISHFPILQLGLNGQNSFDRLCIISAFKQIMLVSRSPPSFCLQTVPILPLTPIENRATADQMALSPSHLPETLMRDCEEVCQCDNNYRNYTIRQLQKTPLVFEKTYMLLP